MAMRRAALKAAFGPRFKRKTERRLSRNLIAIGKLAISNDYKGLFLPICFTIRLMTRDPRNERLLPRTLHPSQHSSFYSVCAGTHKSGRIQLVSATLSNLTNLRDQE